MRILSAKKQLTPSEKSAFVVPADETAFGDTAAEIQRIAQEGDPALAKRLSDARR